MGGDGLAVEGFRHGHLALNMGQKSQYGRVVRAYGGWRSDQKHKGCLLRSRQCIINLLLLRCRGDVSEVDAAWDVKDR